VPPPNDYYNLFGNVPIPRQPTLFGSRSAGGPMSGAIEQLFPMLAESFRSKFGGFGFNFGADMNVTAAEFARQYVQELGRARQAGAAADTGQVNELLRGVARMIGHEVVPGARRPDGQAGPAFAPEVEASLGRLSAFTGQNILPTLAAMFPEQVDAVFQRGSMAVANSTFTRFTRFMTDPLTGGRLSADADFGVRVLNPLLDDKTLRASSGLGAGRLAATGEALFNQGLLGSGADIADTVKRVKDTTGLDVGEVGKDVQASRVRDRIAQYAKTIAAINDIFAEAGRPNAPMGELLAGLQKMTQGGFGTMDPNTLSRVVRTMHAATQTSGMSMEMMQQLSGIVGEALRASGGPAQMAGPITAYMSGYGKRFADLGFGVENPEGLTRDETILRTAQRMADTAGSEQANLMGAVLYQAQFAAADSPLRAVAEAFKNRETKAELADGKVFDLVNLTGDAVTGLFRDSGLTDEALRSQLMARNQNQYMMRLNPEAALLYGNRAAAAEYERSLTQQFLVPFTKGDRAQADKILESLRQVAVDPAKQGLSDAELTIEALRRTGMGDAQAKEEASRLAPFLGVFGESTGYKTVGGMFRAAGRDIYDAGDAEFKATIDRGARMAALTHLGRGGPIKNIARTISEAGDATTPLGFLGIGLRMAGMVTNDEVENALAAPAFAAPSVAPLVRGDDIKGMWDWLGNLRDPKGGMIGAAYGPTRGVEMRDPATGKLEMTRPRFAGGGIGGGWHDAVPEPEPKPEVGGWFDPAGDWFGTKPKPGAPASKFGGGFGGGPGGADRFFREPSSGWEFLRDVIDRSTERMKAEPVAAAAPAAGPLGGDTRKVELTAKIARLVIEGAGDMLTATIKTSAESMTGDTTAIAPETAPAPRSK